MPRIKNYVSRIISYLRNIAHATGIQMTILISFTVLSVCSMTFLGVTLYRQFVQRMEAAAKENSTQLLSQTAINLEDYLRSMRRISDAMYYSVIKDTDLASENMDGEMDLLYQANQDSLISIACYANDGTLICAAPVANQKSRTDVTEQEWFTDAMGQMENLHFSTPHVQNLFDESTYRYYWVVSLSRAVELTRGGNSSLGVLLVDMNYSSIEQILKKANGNSSDEYVYLMDGDGEIIYHPKQKQIYSGIFEENNISATSYDDGSTEETFAGERRLVTVKTISYTGWKIVSVVPLSAFEMGLSATKYFVIMIVGLILLVVVLINRLVSARIALPLQKLNTSVQEWEAGNLNPSIYVGGSAEVEHLGRTLRSTVEQNQQLMHDIVIEQEEKRKSELDALQSQINPHFLYNTLDSVVWMIEGERYDDAVFMITELASLFRISLSRGKTIISIEDEVKHAENYMNIQKVRFKNKFQFEFLIDEDILHCCTVKLVLQPLLENAIYYGVEYMDGDGVITVRGYRVEKSGDRIASEIDLVKSGDRIGEGIIPEKSGEHVASEVGVHKSASKGDIILEVEDNGLGMTQDTIEDIMSGKPHARSHGSGVGLRNVHNRIALRFGADYGIWIDSVPDEGTRVCIRLPYIEYSEKAAEALERQGGRR